MVLDSVSHRALDHRSFCYLSEQAFDTPATAMEATAEFQFSQFGHSNFNADVDVEDWRLE